MAKFTDAKGGEWVLSLDVAAVRRMRDATGFDLWRVASEQFGPLRELSADVLKFTATAYAAMRPEAEKRGLSLDGFESLVSGDALQSLSDAFGEAAVDFFPKALRDELRRVKAIGAKVDAAVAAEMEAKLAEWEKDPLAMLRPNDSPTDLPGSPASAPTDSV